MMQKPKFSLCLSVGAENTDDVSMHFLSSKSYSKIMLLTLIALLTANPTARAGEGIQKNYFQGLTTNDQISAAFEKVPTNQKVDAFKQLPDSLRRAKFNELPSANQPKVFQYLSPSDQHEVIQKTPSDIARAQYIEKLPPERRITEFKAIPPDARQRVAEQLSGSIQEDVSPTPLKRTGNGADLAKTLEESKQRAQADQYRLQGGTPGTPGATSNTNGAPNANKSPNLLESLKQRVSDSAPGAATAKPGAAAPSLEQDLQREMGKLNRDVADEGARATSYIDEKRAERAAQDQKDLAKYRATAAKDLGAKKSALENMLKGRNPGATPEMVTSSRQNVGKGMPAADPVAGADSARRSSISSPSGSTAGERRASISGPSSIPEAPELSPEAKARLSGTSQESVASTNARRSSISPPLERRSSISSPVDSAAGGRRASISSSGALATDTKEGLSKVMGNIKVNVPTSTAPAGDNDGWDDPDEKPTKKTPPPSNAADTKPSTAANADPSSRRGSLSQASAEPKSLTTSSAASANVEATARRPSTLSQASADPRTSKAPFTMHAYGTNSADRAADPRYKVYNRESSGASASPSRRASVSGGVLETTTPTKIEFQGSAQGKSSLSNLAKSLISNSQGQSVTADEKTTADNYLKQRAGAPETAKVAMNSSSEATVQPRGRSNSLPNLPSARPKPPSPPVPPRPASPIARSASFSAPGTAEPGAYSAMTSKDGRITGVSEAAVKKLLSQPGMENALGKIVPDPEVSKPSTANTTNSRPASASTTFNPASTAASSGESNARRPSVLSQTSTNAMPASAESAATAKAETPSQPAPTAGSGNVSTARAPSPFLSKLRALNDQSEAIVNRNQQILDKLNDPKTPDSERAGLRQNLQDSNNELKALQSKYTSGSSTATGASSATASATSTGASTGGNPSTAEPTRAPAALSAATAANSVTTSTNVGRTSVSKELNYGSPEAQRLFNASTGTSSDSEKGAVNFKSDSQQTRLDSHSASIGELTRTSSAIKKELGSNGLRATFSEMTAKTNLDRATLTTTLEMTDKAQARKPIMTENGMKYQQLGKSTADGLPFKRTYGVERGTGSGVSSLSEGADRRNLLNMSTVENRLSQSGGGATGNVDGKTGVLTNVQGTKTPEQNPTIRKVSTPGLSGDFSGSGSGSGASIGDRARASLSNGWNKFTSLFGKKDAGNPTATTGKTATGAAPTGGAAATAPTAAAPDSNPASTLTRQASVSSISTGSTAPPAPPAPDDPSVSPDTKRPMNSATSSSAASSSNPAPTSNAASSSAASLTSSGSTSSSAATADESGSTTSTSKNAAQAALKPVPPKVPNNIEKISNGRLSGNFGHVIEHFGPEDGAPVNVRARASGYEAGLAKINNPSPDIVKATTGTIEKVPAAATATATVTEPDVAPASTSSSTPAKPLAPTRPAPKLPVLVGSGNAVTAAAVGGGGIDPDSGGVPGGKPVGMPPMGAGGGGGPGDPSAPKIAGGTTGGGSGGPPKTPPGGTIAFKDYEMKTRDTPYDPTSLKGSGECAVADKIGYGCSGTYKAVSILNMKNQMAMMMGMTGVMASGQSSMATMGGSTTNQIAALQAAKTTANRTEAIQTGLAAEAGAEVLGMNLLAAKKALNASLFKQAGTVKLYTGKTDEGMTGGGATSAGQFDKAAADAMVVAPTDTELKNTKLTNSGDAGWVTVTPGRGDPTKSGFFKRESKEEVANALIGQAGYDLNRRTNVKEFTAVTRANAEALLASEGVPAAPNGPEREAQINQAMNQLKERRVQEAVRHREDVQASVNQLGSTGARELTDAASAATGATMMSALMAMQQGMAAYSAHQQGEAIQNQIDALQASAQSNSPAPNFVIPPANTNLSNGANGISPVIRGDGAMADAEDTSDTGPMAGADDPGNLGQGFNPDPLPSGVPGGPPPSALKENNSQGPGGAGGGISGGSTASAKDEDGKDNAPRSPASSGTGAYESSGAYANAAGGGRGGAGDGPDLNSLLDKFLPKKDDQPSSQNGILDFGQQGAQAEAPFSLLGRDENIFQRVHDAYQNSNRRGRIGG